MLGAAVGAAHPCPKMKNLPLFPPYLFPQGLGAVSPKLKITRDPRGWIYPTLPPFALAKWKIQRRILIKQMLQRKDAQSLGMGFGLLDFGGYKLRPAPEKNHKAAGGVCYGPITISSWEG